ncbi:MFS transporter [Erythrobacter sp. LQ02-29]|uniref:MFS transporter n=1 Tax=Erythrobacter sp. LQ02-29 TaxID=2920384 RepID=UPI001F4D481A|nr:MFS transporter [Erythrobacter sp. LQ02-29]MCP9221381.1 MFS transporter [Erythrobacter sp. LQ02-29]
MAADPTRAAEPAQSLRFLLLYALAWAGGAVAYVPFLTLFLPVRVAEISGSAAVQWLGYMAFGGAVAASVGGVAFGWLSDLYGKRWGWIRAGVVVNVVLLLVMARIETLWLLMATLLIWQLGLNMMLSPLAALAGDCVPDHQKGLLGGLLAFAPAAGAAAGALATFIGIIPRGGMPLQDQMSIVAVMIVACVGPLLLFGKPRPVPVSTGDSVERTREPRRLDRAIVRMWLARLAVQIAEATLFAYLLYYFQSLDPSFRAVDIARITSAVLVLSIPLSLFAGRWADQSGRAIRPLRLSAGIAAVSLALMALSDSIATALSGYILFGVSAAVFLALHSSQTLRVLPSPTRRGRDIGLFNLANTVPSLIMPWLTIAIVPTYGFAPLFWLLALLAGLATFLMMSIEALPKSA